MLEHEDTKIVMVALEGIENILKGGERLEAEGKIPAGALVMHCESLDLPQQLDACQHSDDNDVYHKAQMIVMTWFRSHVDTAYLGQAEDGEGYAPEGDAYDNAPPAAGGHYAFNPGHGGSGNAGAQNNFMFNFDNGSTFQ
jgi:hypothetical protein